MELRSNETTPKTEALSPERDLRQEGPRFLRESKTLRFHKENFNFRLWLERYGTPVAYTTNLPILY